MATPQSAAINRLAIAEMLTLPKLYGPNGIYGPIGPPPELVAALEQLETASVDPSLLAAGQTGDVVEANTSADLAELSKATTDNLGLIGVGAYSIIFGEFFLAFRSQFDHATAALETDVQSFTAGTAPPVTIVDPPPPPANGAEQVLVTNITRGVSDWETGQLYSGPVAGLTQQFVTATADNLAITTTKLNSFIHTGTGDDAIDASLTTRFQASNAQNGGNVLDGGGGSNFLKGAKISRDTFYIDNRNPAADVFSTIVNFHAGDTATVFGVNASDFQLRTIDNIGAAGATGLDFAFAAPGRANVNLVLAGYTSADLANGHLTIGYGRTDDLPGLPGSQFFNIVGTA